MKLVFNTRMFLICFVPGLIVVMKALNDSFKFYTGGETSLRKVVINSLFKGLGSCLIFMAVFFFMGYIQNYIWNFKSILVSSLLSLCVGFVVFFGTFWRIYSAIK